MLLKDIQVTPALVAWLRDGHDDGYPPLQVEELAGGLRVLRHDGSPLSDREEREVSGLCAVHTAKPLGAPRYHLSFQEGVWELYRDLGEDEEPVLERSIEREEVDDPTDVLHIARELHPSIVAIYDDEAEGGWVCSIEPLAHHAAAPGYAEIAA
jgi:hypothetical protein